MQLKEISKDIYDLDAWLDEGLGAEGTPEREKNREKAWEEYNAQILLEARKNARLTQAELAKRMAKAEASLGLDFSSPDSIARYYMEDLRHKKREVMKLLLLNTRSRLISEMDVSTGTINSTLVSPRELFVEALQKNAVSIILLHNHPSGDPTPSKEDLLTTRRIREAGALIGIELLDHIIIGDNCYFSLREKGFFSQESANR